MIDKGECGNGCFWNPSIFEYGCDKSCEIVQYLDYKNFNCRKNLLSKLVEEFSENIDGNGMIYNATVNDHRKV